MKTRQNFTIGRGEDRIKRFRVLGGAGATAASWYCAATEFSPATEHDLDLSTIAGTITLVDAGEDCLADLHFSATATELLTPGYRHHELWVTVGGLNARRAVGTVTVNDTLRN